MLCDLSPVPSEIFLGTVKQQLLQFSELLRRSKENQLSLTQIFEGDTRERVLLALAGEYRRRSIVHLRIEPGTEVYESWRPLLDKLDPEKIGPPRSLPDSWRQSLEHTLPQLVTLWATAGFQSESLETALRRFLEDNRDSIDQVAIADVFPPSVVKNQLASPAVETSGDDRQRTSRSGYQSPLKNAIALVLMKDSGLSDFSICGLLDESETLELPRGWKDSLSDRSFQTAYTSPRHKNKIASLISKVRSDLRKLGLI